MNENAVVLVGQLVVPMSSDLREQFTTTHRMMSRQQSDLPSYSRTEQEEMRLLCEAYDAANEFDEVQYECNLLELLHHLASQGVEVPKISADIRCYSILTRRLSMRLHLDARKRHEKEAQLARLHESGKLIFKEPVLAAGAVA